MGRAKPPKIAMEDWDFRTPGADIAADFYYSRHYVEVLAADTLRLSAIESMVKHDIATVTEDGEHAEIVPGKELVFKGFTSASTLRERLTSGGRFEHRVHQSLWREWEKYGRIKLTVRPTNEAVRALYGSPPEDDERDA